ncbi:hypothetical protein V5799_021752 [Amblyomma americanum]|uniref:Fibronectin type-III domain-containing protein n=1 Tax=Amblyomma americanum TaxID=6943 RepID=A0AAQ4FMK0_AMBAM
MPNEIGPHPELRVTDLKVAFLDSTQAEVTWIKHAGPVSGYQVVICKIAPPPDCRHDETSEASLNLHQLKPNTTFEVRVTPFRYSKEQRLTGEEAVLQFTTLPPPKLDAIQVRPLNSTSLEVTWKAVSGARIMIEICPVPSTLKKCPLYHTGSHMSKLIINDLKPETFYTINAIFSTTAGGLSYPGEHISMNVTTPAQGDGKNAASLPSYSGLWMSSLLYFLVHVCCDTYLPQGF